MLHSLAAEQTSSFDVWVRSLWGCSAAESKPLTTDESRYCSCDDSHTWAGIFTTGGSKQPVLCLKSGLASSREAAAEKGQRSPQQVQHEPGACFMNKQEQRARRWVGLHANHSLTARERQTWTSLDRKQPQAERLLIEPDRPENMSRTRRRAGLLTPVPSSTQRHPKVFYDFLEFI